MKINPSYCCLILLSLLKVETAVAQGVDFPANAYPNTQAPAAGPSAAGTPVAGPSSAVVPAAADIERTARDEYDSDDQETDAQSREEYLPPLVTHSSRWDHENSLWHATIKPEGEKVREESFLLDRLSWTERRENSGLLDERNLSWNLGLGGGAKAFGEGKGRWNRSAKVDRHQFIFELGLDGALRQNSEYQSLDRQYSDAYRSGSDVEAEPNNDRIIRESGLSLRLGDTWSIDRGLALSAEAFQRNDNYRVGSLVDDRSRYSQVGFGLRKDLDARQRWELSSRLSEMYFESRVVDFRQKQNFAEANTSFLFPLKGRYTWGLGYVANELRNVRRMSGPSLILLREPDERLTWRAVLSYLNGPGNEHFFGELIGSYRLDRTKTLRWSFVRNVDLLSTYSILTTERLPLTAQQDSNLRTYLEWELRKAEKTFVLRATHDQQKYQDAQVREESLSAAWVEPWNLQDTTTLTVEARRNQELGPVFSETKRNYLIGSYAWKHEMESGSRLFGAKPYFHLAASYESLADDFQDYRLDRIIVLLGLGQEW